MNKHESPKDVAAVKDAEKNAAKDAAANDQTKQAVKEVLAEEGILPDERTVGPNTDPDPRSDGLKTVPISDAALNRDSQDSLDPNANPPSESRLTEKPAEPAPVEGATPAPDEQVFPKPKH